MRVLGFNLQNSQLRFVVLEGSKNQPIYVDGKKLINNNAANTQSLMNWYHDNFLRIIEEQAPDIIGYRVSLFDATLEQISRFYYPYGVLNSLCHSRGDDLREFSSQKVGKRYPQSFGLPKGADVYGECDRLLPNLTPKDQGQKDAALQIRCVILVDNEKATTLTF